MAGEEAVEAAGRPGAQPDRSLAPDRYDVFLSHNGLDKPAVQQIAGLLKRERLEPWIDCWDLTAGEPWLPELDRALAQVQAVAVFVGPAGLSTWSRYETFAAISRAAEDPDFRVFPVLLPGAGDPFDASTLPDFLSTRTWVDLRGGFEDEGALQALINGLKGVPPRHAVHIPPGEGVCPYRGLETFGEEDARFFFGREADVQRLSEALKESRFLAIVGPSGVGKSSVALAGLLPALRAGALPGSAAWRIVTLRPGSAPLRALAGAAAPLARVATAEAEAGLVASREWLDGVAVAVAGSEPDARLLWLVDQFEEVFSAPPEAASAFISNLLHASTRPDGRTTVVLTLWADFYGRCAAYPELAAQVAARQYLVSPMGREGMRAAIVEPALLSGLELESGLTEQILDDVEGQPGALPLLEHALRELWQRRRGSMLTLEGYRASGGVAEAIGLTADEVYASLGPADQQLLRQVLFRLIQVGDGAEDTRRRVRLSELAPRAGMEASVEAIVQPFVERRLLTAGQDPASGEAKLEVAHEALIRAWPALRAWVDERRADLLEHARLRHDVERWAERGKDESALYRGARLTAAVDWQGRAGEMLNDQEREFLTASVGLREREQRARRRRIELTIGGLTVALAAISVFAVLFLLQRNDAREQADLATSRELAAGALQVYEGDEQLGLLLAREAVDRAGTQEAFDALRRVLLESPVPRFPHIDELSHATISPDGDLLVTVGLGDKVVLWDAETGQLLKEMEGHAGRINKALFSPDGSLLATAAWDSVFIIWDVDRDGPAFGTALYELPGREDYEGSFPNPFDFSDDGTRLLTQAEDGVVRLYDARFGILMQEFAPDGLVIDGFDLDRTGERVLLTLSDDLLIEGDSPQQVQLWTRGASSPDHVWPLPLDLSQITAVFDPDGARVITGIYGASNGRESFIDLWSAEDGSNLASLLFNQDQKFSRLYKTVANPWDPTSLAVTGLDGPIYLWEVSDEEPFTTLLQRSPIQAMAFGGGGRVLISKDEENSATLWSLDAVGSWGRRATVRGTVNDVRFAEVATSAPLFVTSNFDNVARLFSYEALEATREELLRQADARIEREFTREEREQYLHE
jgi:WD40 repeat protein